MSAFRDSCTRVAASACDANERLAGLGARECRRRALALGETKARLAILLQMRTAGSAPDAFEFFCPPVRILGL